MSLATIRLQPGMDINTLIAALNENFALLENLNRTQIFKDETGTNRIIIGRFPDGRWGIIISKEGEDVVRLFNE